MALLRRRSLNTFSAAEFVVRFPFQPIIRKFKSRFAFPAFWTLFIRNTCIFDLLYIDINSFNFPEEIFGLFKGISVVLHHKGLDLNCWTEDSFFIFLFESMCKAEKLSIFENLFNSFLCKTFNHTIELFLWRLFLWLRSSSSRFLCTLFFLLSKKLIDSFFKINLHRMPNIVYLPKFINKTDKRNSLDFEIFYQGMFSLPSK